MVLEFVLTADFVLLGPNDGFLKACDSFSLCTKVELKALLTAKGILSGRTGSQTWNSPSGESSTAQAIMPFTKSFRTSSAIQENQSGFHPFRSLVR